MIHLLLILISLIAFYLAYRLFLIRRSISRTEEELRSISCAPIENRILKLPFPDRRLEGLLKAINQNLDATRTERLAFQKKELQLKEQVENISHDLRTPLTAILGYLKMIDTGNLSAEDQEYLDIAIRKSYTLQDLVSRFYELTQVTSEDFHLELTPVDIGRLLRETCLDHYELIEKEDLQFQMDLPNVPTTIYGETQALERIFSNMIQNGIRYAKSELDVRIIESSDSGKIQLIFENDIAPEMEIDDPDRLFDRFYIQEQSRSHGGTGLGLTISKHLTEHMNGTMQAAYYNRQEKRILAFTLCFPYLN